jgi:hypothetical protein
MSTRKRNYEKISLTLLTNNCVSDIVFVAVLLVLSLGATVIFGRDLDAAKSNIRSVGA